MKEKFNFMWYLPAFLTIIRIVLTPVFAYLFWLGDPWMWWAVWVFSIAAITDFADGYVARRYGLVSEAGAFLDPLADKILILVVFGCFIAKGLLPWWIVAVVVGRDFLVTWLRTKAVKQGKPLPTFWLAKFKTTVQFMAIYLLFAKMLIPHDLFAWCVVDVLAVVSIWSMLLLAVQTGVGYCIAYARIKKNN